MEIAAQIKLGADDIKLPKVTANNDTFNNIVNLVYIALASIALFYVVRGALLYVTHGSEPNVQKEARETILYAIVAIVGSSLVFSLIKFVIWQLGGGF